jgi:hypothetical protein
MPVLLRGVFLTQDLTAKYCIQMIYATPARWRLAEPMLSGVNYRARKALGIEAREQISDISESIFQELSEA